MYGCAYYLYTSIYIKCRVSYGVKRMRVKQIRRQVAKDLEVCFWSGREGREGDFGAFPMVSPGPGGVGMCIGVLGVDTLTRSSPKGLGSMEISTAEYAATQIASAIFNFLQHQAKQARRR